MTADQSAGSSSSQVFGRLRAVDSLRGLAILLVFTYHAWQFSGSPTVVVALAGFSADLLTPVRNGFWGVELFMVVSGFVLFLPLARAHPGNDQWTVRDYAFARVRRILPPYYFAIAFLIILPEALVVLARLFHRHANWQPLPSPWDVLTHLTLTHTLFPGTWQTIQGSLWSMGLEAQFYLVFPLLVLAFRRFGPLTIGAVIFSSILYRTLFDNLLADQPFTTTFLVSITFLGRWMEFGTGMGAAYLVGRARREGRTLGGPVTLGLLALGFGAYAVLIGGPLVTFHLVPVNDGLISLAAFCFLVAGCAGSATSRRALEWRPIAALGVVSYSLFLLHQNVLYYMSEALRVVGHVFGEPRLAILCTIGLAVLVAAAAVSFRFVERPFLRRRTQVLVRQELGGA